MRKLFAVMLLLLMMTCTAFAEGTPEGEPSAEPEAEPIALSEVSMTLEPLKYEETGAAITPKPVLTYGEETLTEGTHYTLEYTDNIKVGNASVTATAVEGSGYTGSKSLQFEIYAKPAPEPVDLSKAAIKLQNTTYYKTGKAIQPLPTLTCSGKTLVRGTDYTLQYTNNINVGTATVKATAVAGKGYKGTKSATFSIIPPKPAAAAISVKSAKPYVTATWKKVTCTGYALQVSTTSDFKSVTKYTLKTNTKNIPKLKNGKTYYFRVIAYNTENGKTTYGAWSSCSSKVNTTGPVGNKYSLNGELIKNKTIKIGGDYLYYNTSGIKSGCDKKMWDSVKNTKSKTKYLIAVDCTKNRTCIYKGKKGNWALLYYWPCTTGKKSTPTIKGTFKVKGKVSHFGEAHGYTCWYATKIKYEYYFHSVLYKPHSKKTIIAGTLGKNLSHGCIRLSLKNAKWIYKNCKKKTAIIIY